MSAPEILAMLAADRINQRASECYRLFLGVCGPTARISWEELPAIVRDGWRAVVLHVEREEQAVRLAAWLEKKKSPAAPSKRKKRRKA